MRPGLPATAFYFPQAVPLELCVSPIHGKIGNRYMVRNINMSYSEQTIRMDSLCFVTSDHLESNGGTFHTDLPNPDWLFGNTS
jgi:hypothetical protein